jgi:hypothetical protein
LFSHLILGLNIFFVVPSGLLSNIFLYTLIWLFWSY